MLVGITPSLPQEDLHALRLGLERGPQEWREPRAVLRVDLCTQVEEGVAHTRLVAEDCIHERGAASVIPVINSILNGLCVDDHMIVT